DFVSQARWGDPVVREPLRMPMKTIAGSIEGLEAKYGVFAVIGNHDFWYDQDTVKKELEAVGIDVLFDEIHELDINGSALSLLGLRDHASIHSYKKYLDEIKPAALKARGDVIVLTHSPDVVPYMTVGFATATRTRLVLAGHTHGGQVWLPGLGSLIVPSSYGQTFAFGYVNFNGVDVFITSGIGTSILPVRFMMPPEIAVLTLRSNQ
ncbi:MAG: hypothetical protein OEM82_05420, partial [Acidobacteriota bacterium]|nr:hypothetical protein [Acidobacteriota bacterium]